MQCFKLSCFCCCFSCCFALVLVCVCVCVVMVLLYLTQLSDYVAVNFVMKVAFIFYVCVSSPSALIIPRLIHRDVIPDESSLRDFVLPGEV
jgi:hypothetical protein